MIKQLLLKIPVLGAWLSKCYQGLKLLTPFTDSGSYWENRYRKGGNSGAGSYAELASFKADIINAFVAQHAISKVIEFGCGDGHQLGLFNIPAYTGYDVSAAAIAICEKKYGNDLDKQFHLISDYQGETAELVLSLDVIFHLVEEEIYHQYMERLFAAAIKYVIIYSSNQSASTEDKAAPHFRHRRFTDWINVHRPDASLLKKVPNAFPYQGDEQGGSVSDFYIYEVS